MEGLTWLLALALGLAGALSVYWQQVEAARKKVEAAELQARKEALAREQLAAKKSKSKPKKVDITAELKKKKQAQESEDPSKEHASFLHALKGHKFALTAAAYSPNGRFIATASTDRTIRLHLRESLGDKNARTHQINIEYDHVTAMTFSSDGRLLVSHSLGQG
jgi:sRNA-binding protein